MKTIFILGLVLGLSAFSFADEPRKTGNFQTFYQAYDDYYGRNPAKVPVAQGTYLKYDSNQLAADLPQSLILNGLNVSESQGRPFILDSATAYNKYAHAASALKKALANSKHSGFFVVMKFNEFDFLAPEDFPGVDLSKMDLIKAFPNGIPAEKVNLKHFKKQYDDALKEMGISGFTVVMPHGNFFKNYSDFLKALVYAGVNPNETGVGASNFLQKSALDEAKMASQNAGFKFIAIEYEKNLRCNFESVNEFVAQNPDIFSFYVGVFGGKEQSPPYTLIARGVEMGKSVPEHSKELLQLATFREFSSPMEIAMNAAIRKHPRPVAIFSTANLTRLQENYQLKRQIFSSEAEAEISKLESQGPSVRYDKGVRPADLKHYKLVDPKEYFKKNQDNKQVRIKKTRDFLAKSSPNLLSEDDKKNLDSDAKLMNDFGVLAAVEMLNAPMSWRDLQFSIQKRLKLFNLDTFKTPLGKELALKRFNFLNELNSLFETEETAKTENSGRELVSLYLPELGEKLIQIVKQEIEKEKPDVGHKIDHYLRVVYWTHLFIQELQKRDFVQKNDEEARLAILAALFHDVKFVPKDSSELERIQASTLAENAFSDLRRSYFPELKLSEENEILIRDAIRTHSWSRGERPTSRVGEALMSADRIDALGVIGFYRTLIVSSSFKGTQFLDPIHPFHVQARPEKVYDDKKYSMDHFFIKIFKLTSGVEGKQPPIPPQLHFWTLQREASLRKILDSIAQETLEDQDEIPVSRL